VQGQPLRHRGIKERITRYVSLGCFLKLLRKDLRQGIVQLRRFDGFGESGLDSQLCGRPTPLDGRKQNHGQGGARTGRIHTFSAQLGRQRQAVHGGHLQVQESHVKGITPADPVQRFER
jgi:hypothetical protein